MLNAVRNNEIPLRPSYLPSGPRFTATGRHVFSKVSYETHKQERLFTEMSVDEILLNDEGKNQSRH